uniref:NADH-ubiquinone oxidoreductase chain 6 n=1 Tax=Limnius perrisi TaxID=195217 RepID=A0A0S2MNR0_9COLE|nr:NADH deshydrogenase subunit 6 [Limnius perrisi]
MFLFLKHPLSMGMSLLNSINLHFNNHGILQSQLLILLYSILIMVGGMLVLFIYMTSIASNEMFKYSNKLMITLMITMLMGATIMAFQDQMISNLNIFNIDLTTLNYKENYEMSLNKYLNFPSNMMLFFMIIYLFITLIAVVKITNISYGPLRQKL